MFILLMLMLFFIPQNEALSGECNSSDKLSAIEGKYDAEQDINKNMLQLFEHHGWIPDIRIQGIGNIMERYQSLDIEKLEELYKKGEIGLMYVYGNNYSSPDKELFTTESCNALMSREYINAYNLRQFSEIEKRYGSMRYRQPIEDELAKSFQWELERDDNSSPIGPDEGQNDALEDIKKFHFAFYEIRGGMFFIPGIRNVSRKETAYSQITALLDKGVITLRLLHGNDSCFEDNYANEQMTHEYIEHYNVLSLDLCGVMFNSEAAMDFSNTTAESMNKEGQKAATDVQRDSVANNLKLYSISWAKCLGLDKQLESVSPESRHDIREFIYSGKATLRQVFQSPGYFYDDVLPQRKLSYGYMVQYNRIMLNAIQEYLRSAAHKESNLQSLK